jgi:hypothetical protein
MAFFFEAAKKIAKHLATWGENGPLKERLDRAFQRDRAMIESVQAETLRIGYDGDPRYTARSRGPVLRSNEVALEFIEEWTYPSSDLLRWLDRAYPYDTREPPAWIRDPSNGTTPDNMLNWEGRLLMVARSGGQTLHVAMHYNVLPWNKPRAMQKFLGDYAQHLRKNGEPAPGRRQVERDFLQELKVPDPEIGERVWHIFVDPISNAKTCTLI